MSWHSIHHEIMFTAVNIYKQIDDIVCIVSVDETLAYLQYM